jgi:uncharacterized phage protein gp47/JayE
MIKYGVSEAGFIKKPYKKIKTDIHEKARTIFGEGVDLSVYSPIGLFVKMLSWNTNILWQELEHVYYSNWLETAEGVSLDRIVSLGGLQREPAKHAIIHDVKFSGKEDTEIEEGFEVQTKEEVKFRTMSSGTISGIKLSCNLVAGDKKITVTEGSLSELSEKMLVYGDGIPDETRIDSIDEEGNEIMLTKPADTGGNNVKLTFDPKAFIHCRAVEAGPGGAVVANSVTDIGTPLEGLDEVINENPSIGAMDIETDSALRKRYKTEGVENTGSSVDAIRSALLKVEDIVSVVVQENITLYEVNGMLPKSVECMVQGGRDEDVALAIFETKSAGIATCGNRPPVEINYYDKRYEIYFTRPDKMDIEVSLNLIVNDEWEDAIEDVKTNIIKYIGGTDLREGRPLQYPRLDPGSTIYPWRIKAANKDVKGIENIDTVRINNSPGILTLGPREIPHIDNFKITITVSN